MKGHKKGNKEQGASGMTVGGKRRWVGGSSRHTCAGLKVRAASGAVPHAIITHFSFPLVLSFPFFTLNQSACSPPSSPLCHSSLSPIPLNQSPLFLLSISPQSFLSATNCAFSLALLSLFPSPPFFPFLSSYSYSPFFLLPISP